MIIATVDHSLCKEQVVSEDLTIGNEKIFYLVFFLASEMEILDNQLSNTFKEFQKLIKINYGKAFKTIILKMKE